MSAFMSLIGQGEAVLLTDGACWHPQNKTLEGTAKKIFAARSQPMAIALRGCWGVGSALAQEICDIADREGVAATIDDLQDMASELHRNCGAGKTNETRNEVFITALLPDGKGAHCGFATFAEGRCNSNDYVGAYRVWSPPGDTYRGGPEIEDAEIEAAGLARLPAESVSDYGRRCGADIFEIMRRKPGQDFDGVTQFLVGGHLDMTVIRPEGCTTERLRTWPDELGRPVDPYSKANRSTGYGQ